MEQVFPKAMAGDIPVYCAHDNIVDITKLVGNPKNPNKHSKEQIKLLARIIQGQGWRSPITVSKRSGFIVKGHGRLAAAIEMKTETAPVDYQDYDSEAAEWADLVADNRLSELSELDEDMAADMCDYHYQHEPILYGWKPGGSHKWYSDRKQSTVWNYDRPKKNEVHPTMKPLQLIAYPIMNSSMVNSIVLDPFGGSGSTLIACEQTDRICCMIELDERYADVIVKRFIDQAGGDGDVYLIRDGAKTAYCDISKEGEANE